MPLKDTISSFKGILDGEYDDLPEQALYIVGGIEEAIAEASNTCSRCSAARCRRVAGSRLGADRNCPRRYRQRRRRTVFGEARDGLCAGRHGRDRHRAWSRSAPDDVEPGERVQPRGRRQFFDASGGAIEIQPHLVTVLADALRARDLDEEAAVQASNAPRKRCAIAVTGSGSRKRRPSWCRADPRDREAAVLQVGPQRQGGVHRVISAQGVHRPINIQVRNGVLSDAY